MAHSSEDDEYRVSLIEFKNNTVNIKSWWIDQAKYALLMAALGDPEVDSIYSRDFIDSTAEQVITDGVHFVKESDEGGTESDEG